MMPIVDHWFLAPQRSSDNLDAVRRKLQLACNQVNHFSLMVEYCYNIEFDSELNQEEHDCVAWLLSDHGYQPPSKETFFTPEKVKSSGALLEIGPRLTFTTAFSTLAVSVAVAAGLTKVRRIEVSRRYLLTTKEGSHMPELRATLLSLVLDRMTEMVYEQPITNFQLGEPAPNQVFRVPVLEEGADCLRRLNAQLGLGMDDFDIDFYTDLFRNKFGRNPSNVECFDLAQSNSEHSRHWFFKGALVIDGELQSKSLFDLVMSTQKTTNRNNTIAFHDNSSAIEGAEVPAFLPKDPRQPSAFEVRSSFRDICFTAETHNFPTGVAPFPGATTGTGGRIRDVQSTGRGAHVVMGTAGYAVGLLRLENWPVSGETAQAREWPLPGNLARPCDILLRASDGASDYGNKFGEPVLTGFMRTFGQVVDGERIEWLKPIMFSGGLGQLPAEGRAKVTPEPGMLLVKVGGPAYRIGVGGGAASSMQVHGDNKQELDFNAVQRGDAEMEQKMNRVIRACLELREGNPILSIHDQGAGGNANVLKELCEPAGAEIDATAFALGDPSLSVLELWGAEYQESNALLLRADSRSLLEALARREDCPVDFVGRITGDKRIRLRTSDGSCPVDLDLDLVLAKMPQKRFQSQRKVVPQAPCVLPLDTPPAASLERVLRVPAVGSKRFLTVKVDRSVTGLVASQQCVGPFHTPVADVAVVALSYFSTEGAATAIGEQPIKMLLDPAAGARLAATEALTNLVFAPVTGLADVKCSCNWMWPAKLPHEGAALYDACVALTDFLRELRVGIDGGKDSLSMAARVRDPETEESTVVKSPRCLVVSTYARCPDITKVVTPELRGGSSLVLVRFAPAAASDLEHRMGGSALLASFAQLGDRCPDLDRPDLLRAGFEVTQRLLAAGQLLAGHDVSDGGLATALVEMALASQVGLDVDLRLPSAAAPNELLFAEEPGLVLETSPAAVAAFHEAGVFAAVIGRSLSTAEPTVRIAVNGVAAVEEANVSDLMASWEAVSHQLERRQCLEACAVAEQRAMRSGRYPTMECGFSWRPREAPSRPLPTGAPRMAVLREVGSNGDRELAAAFFRAGFEVWDLSMEDLRSGSGLATLDAVRGIAFAGGFSRADVLGSAKGWAASIQRSPRLLAAFSAFRARPDTFSLGICNGCQLMARLGLLDDTGRGLGAEPRVRLLPNRSRRFESRFPVVRVVAGPSVLLRGMAGARLGVWVAHGEGRFDLDLMTADPGCPVAAAMRYVGPDGAEATYPFNPNGSQEHLAGVCSLDGRHTALMPHPERSVLRWQWPWLPREAAAGWPGDAETPWMKVFYNAFEWCQAVAASQG